MPEISNRPLRVLKEHEGGFGRVYIAETNDGDKYALKTLKWELGLNKHELAEEASKLVDLPYHPNIIQIEGLFWYDGFPYICMPYCIGNLYAQIPKGNGIDSNLAIQILTQIVSGLLYIHDRVGMLHLDLKPQNILISEDGSYVISDFGIAQLLPLPRQNGIYAELFVSNIAGTVSYMSPEHFVSGRLSAKSDIFALGVILFELLTGRNPFLTRSYEQTRQNILTLVPQFTFTERLNIPNELQGICLRCLEKNPSHRPSALEIYEALDATTSEGFSTITIEHTDISNLVNKATVLLKLGRFDEAQRSLEKCVMENPWYLSASLNLSELHFHQGNIDEAVKLAEHTLDIAAWYSVDAKSLGTLLSNLASYYLSVNPEQSMKYARRASKLDQYDWQALGNLAEACRVLGEAYSRPDLIEEGIAATQKALELNPKDVKLRVNYAGLLLAAKDYATLSPFIIELLNEIGGDDIPLRVHFIRFLIAAGQIEDALSWLNPMRSYKPLQNIVAQLDAEIGKRHA